MDNKTWQQGNLGGSTGNGRNLQAANLQLQQLSVTASASVFPGTSSLASHSTAHWQRVTYCGAVNGLASSQSHILSQQQHNQAQHQASQLRYFQVQKPAQYSSLLGSSTSGSHHQHNQTDQHHFARHYAVVASSPALSSVSLASNDSTLSDRSSVHKRESLQYSSYLTNHLQSTNKSASQALTLKSLEESQFNNFDQSSNRQNLSSLSPVYHSRYKILTSGNFLIPATGQVSLTTCFALSSSFDPLGVEATSSASSSLLGQVSLLPTIIPVSAKLPLPRFVNAFEAVPDMLRDIRPGTSTIFARSTLTPFLVSQKEFSYHASKPRLSIRVETSVVARVESLRDKNWPELSLKGRRAIATIFDRSRLRGISGKCEKSVWKKIASHEELQERKSWNSTSRHQNKLQKARIRTCRSSEKPKTYADAVQVTGTSSPKLHRDISIMNLRENRRPSKMCPSFFHTSTPKIELRGVKKKREYQESCEEDNEYSSTSTASTGSYYGRSRTPESSSSPEAAILKNSKGSSSSSPAHEMDEYNCGQFEINGHQGNVPSRKRLCKMAEMFCFGELENAAFFRAFDEYNRRRRRMSYTQKLDDGTDVFRKAVEAAQAILFGNDSSSTFQNFTRGNDSAIMSPIRINGINGMDDQGAFKVLQKVKECDDGTGAIYTNSWRPEELHFLRRCYQDKNI